MIYHEHALKYLVSTEDKKNLISSMLTTEILEDDRFDDFIRGMGEGLIFLLHGELGVGKTYTAGILRSIWKRV